MNLKLYSSLAILLFVIAGCSNNKRVDPEFKYERIGASQTGDPISANQFAKVTIPGTNLQGTQQSPQLQTDILNPPHGKPGHICGVAEGSSTNRATSSVIAQPQTTTAVAPITNNKPISLNPAHGQPGHVCGIAVGAPLNGKPTPLPTQPQPTAPAAANPISTATDKSLNPAHGQSGHRCDINVGAPLNSKAPSASNKPQPIVTPAATTISTPTDKSLNPAHGQPGHRCDINVGAPLNSKAQTAPNQNPAAIVNPNPTEAASRWGGPTLGNTLAATQQNQPATNDVKSVVAPGMNPAHGQPGHRCDIPAGTSLSQPIVKTDALKNANPSTPAKKDPVK